MSEKTKNTGLFFGSFNPIHAGHVMIANYMVEFEKMDEIWFIVSPQNPFKSEGELLPQEHRFNMVKVAINGFSNIKVSDVEFSMPRPSYTINTLNYLSQKHPDSKFHILMGNDNIINIHRWKDAKTILENYPVLVYPRSGYPIDRNELPANVRITGAPLIDLSSTMIREWLKEKHDIRAFLPQGVYEYITTQKLF